MSPSEARKLFGYFLMIVGVGGFLLWAGARAANSVQTNRKCVGHLKRAADASTIKLAERELDIAIKYIEENRLTYGHTAILWTTPATDVNFWFSNLMTAREELHDLPPETTSLEKTNVLMKLRETLLDDTRDGVRVTRPGGISIYPYNAIFCLWCLVSLLLAGCGFYFFITERPRDARKYY